MNHTTFKVKCLETLTLYDKVFFIEGKEYVVTEHDREYIAIDEQGQPHTLATGGVRTLKWFHDKFEVINIP